MSLFMPVTLLAESGAAAASIAPEGNANSASGATTYTFTSVGIGSGTHVIVGVIAIASGARTISTLTVGGNSALRTVQANATTLAGLVICNHPGGTTANIVVTFSAAMLRCAVVAWSVSGLSSTTETDTASATSGDPTTVSLDIPANGFGVSVIGSNATSSLTLTWTGLTEDFDTTYASGRTISGASQEFATAQTALSISADWSGAPSTQCMVAAAWR